MTSSHTLLSAAFDICAGDTAFFGGSASWLVSVSLGLQRLERCNTRCLCVTGLDSASCAACSAKLAHEAPLREALRVSSSAACSWSPRLERPPPARLMCASRLRASLSPLSRRKVDRTSRSFSPFFFSLLRSPRDYAHLGLERCLFACATFLVAIGRSCPAAHISFAFETADS